MDRRRLLASIALPAGSVLAGCLERGTPSSEDPNHTGVANPDTNETDSAAGTDDECPERTGDRPEPPDHSDAAPLEYDRTYFAIGESVDRTYPDGTNEGPIDLFETLDDARRVLDFEAVDEDRREDVEAFVAETDFERQRLLYVSAGAPHPNYETLDVHALGADGGTLVGSAVVPKPCYPGDDAQTRLSILVRVAFESDPLDRARVTIVNGQDQLGTFEVTADDPDVTVIEEYY